MVSRSRTGVPTLIRLARALCNSILAFTPIIRQVYPQNVALQAALEAAMIACGQLREELEKEREYGQ